ncbi:ribosome maturation factor RimP [Mycobacterium sp. MYCO198283]|uniref:ribosome maturation factor RimP n=1 Tax=Mycobacterium sp. MYCO198283 TaxID=2883505 RepID=UPI001E416D0B|nr:ribosome maturation factor RimP [Mycobacterium sp. MYCO198283]MCG5433798.1 ribosome maturation factor RimP [Mycobacterium sp. MYCO198283]
MAKGSLGLPSQDVVIRLLGAEFARAGYEIEAVTADDRRRPPRLAIVVDGDEPLTLDTVAQLSQTASQLLDTLPGLDGEYILEVSSPGVDRPLTEAKHFRRARGRKAELTLADGSTLTGRIGELSEGAVRVVVRSGRDWSVREIPLADITQGIVGVEFAPPHPRELELAGHAGREGTP